MVLFQSAKYYDTPSTRVAIVEPAHPLLTATKSNSDPRTRHRLWALHLGIVENLQVPSRHCIKNGLVPPRSRRSATKMLPPLRPDICKQLRINSGPGCEQRIFRDVRTLRSIHFHRSALINCFFAFNRLQRHSSTHLQGRNLANLSRPKRHVGTVEEGLFLVQVPGIVSKVPIVE
jgi:hypothetical protein